MHPINGTVTDPIALRRALEAIAQPTSAAHESDEQERHQLCDALGRTIELLDRKRGSRLAHYLGDMCPSTEELFFNRSASAATG